MRDTFPVKGLFGPNALHLRGARRPADTTRARRNGRSLGSRSAYRRTCRSCGDEIVLVNMGSHWVAFNASDGDTHDCMPSKVR
jgi:hypothetical protein